MVVLSAGKFYSTHCLGYNNVPEVLPGSQCGDPTIALDYTYEDTDNGVRLNEYVVSITNPNELPSIVAHLTFGMPVSLADVSVSGVVGGMTPIDDMVLAIEPIHVFILLE